MRSLFVDVNFNLVKNLEGVVEFRKALKDPLKVQEKLLLRIISKNSNTVYGKMNSFKKIKSIKDYQQFVPIVSYEDLSKYIELMKNGENNILTKDRVIFFATTSGTTKNVKLIPVTKERNRIFRMELLLWSFFFLRTNKDVLRGKTLYFAGPYHEFYTDAGIPCGSISGYLANKAPWFIKSKLAVPPKVYNIMNFNEKTKKIALHSLNSNVTQIGFASPIEAILFFDYLKENRAMLLRELKKKGHFRRAKRLSELKEFKPIDIWPHLKLINCIKSHSNKKYLDVLNEKIGTKIKIRDPGIYSSEGRLSLCVDDSEDVSGVIPVNEIFFEFLEYKEGQTIGTPITIEKLKKNKEYSVIITTTEGLYRYDMGDVVRVVGFKEKLPSIQFVTRNNFLNIAGELAHEDVLVESINIALKKSKISANNFTVIPKITPPNKPRYEILMEFSETISDGALKNLAKALDISLQDNISDYRQMRNEFGRLEAPILSVVKNGSYDSFNKKRVIRGGQPKPIYIAKDSNFRNNFEIEKSTD
ncbi:MAG: GH3 auxin-responsive promoter family protein [Candidatus Nanoarchaeia archaeon]